MLWITSLFLFLFLQAACGRLAEDLRHPSRAPATRATCDPDCSAAINDGDKVENPIDCHQFYACIDKKPVGPLDCPDGMYFDRDPNVLDCVPNGPDECTPSCPGGGVSGTCMYECPAAGTGALIADRYDCSTYYDCDDNEKMHRCENQKAPFFNGETCQSAEKYCCHCKPFCNTGDDGKKVMDPTDCTAYYLCFTAPGVPVYRGRCSTGNFDPFKGECSTTAACFTFCTNVLQPNGCIDVFTCQQSGYFPACPDQCADHFYYCRAEDIGSVVAAKSCDEGSVFDPNTSACVDTSECSIIEYT